jgi:hypothetical protein
MYGPHIYGQSAWDAPAPAPYRAAQWDVVDASAATQPLRRVAGGAPEATRKMGRRREAGQSMYYDDDGYLGQDGYGDYMMGGAVGPAAAGALAPHGYEFPSVAAAPEPRKTRRRSAGKSGMSGDRESGKRNHHYAHLTDYYNPYGAYAYPYGYYRLGHHYFYAQPRCACDRIGGGAGAAAAADARLGGARARLRGATAATSVVVVVNRPQRAPRAPPPTRGRSARTSR